MRERERNTSTQDTQMRCERRCFLLTSRNHKGGYYRYKREREYQERERDERGERSEK
jgi:hypothetical protein